MKKYIILLLCLLLAFCKGAKFEFDSTEFTVKRIEINELPRISLSLQCFIAGKALGNNQALIDNITISCADQDFSIDDISLISPDLDVYYITNFITDNSILSYESTLKKIHPEYQIYKNDVNSLTQIPIMNPEIINLRTYWRKCGNFFDNARSFLQTFRDKYSYKFFVFFISKNTSENEIQNKKYLENIKSIIEQHPNWGIGIFYERGFEEQIKDLNMNLPDQRFFVEQLIDVEYKGPQTQQDKIEDGVRLLMNSNYEIDLRFDKIINPNRESYAVTVSSNYKNKLLSDNYIWYPDLGVIKGYYIEEVENSITFYQENNNFPAMLNILHEEYAFTNYMEFYQLAVNIIKGWLTSVIDTIEDQSPSELLFRSGFDALDIADDMWDLTSPWYLNLKEKFLILYTDYQKDQNYDYSERIDIYNKILEINTENKEMEFGLNECIADQYLAASNYPAALQYLQKAVDINNTSIIRSKLRSNLDKIIYIDFKNQNYQELYNLANEYSQYIENDFKNKTYWAIAAQNIHKSSDALDIFNWLLNNWNKNDLLSWDELLQYMFNVYAENMEFEKAYELLKQVTMDIPEDEFDMVPDLLWAIVYLRSIYIEPFINISNRYFFNNHQTNLKSLQSEFADTELPQYFENIYLLNSSNNLSNVLYGIKESIKLPSHLNRYAKKYIEDDITNWYIQPINSGYFIIQTSNALTSSGEIWYRDLQTNFSEPSIWDNVKEHFTDKARITLVTLTSIMLGNDVAYNGIHNITAYDQVLRDFPDYKYFVIQNSNQKITYNLNFDTENALYLENGWESSSQSPLLYQQEIEYGFNKTKVLDISYPYFKTGIWQGVVRYGFKK